MDVGLNPGWCGIKDDDSIYCQGSSLQAYPSGIAFRNIVVIQGGYRYGTERACAVRKDSGAIICWNGTTSWSIDGAVVKESKAIQNPTDTAGPNLDGTTAGPYNSVCTEQRYLTASGSYSPS